jgi:hypothetical protein
MFNRLDIHYDDITLLLAEGEKYKFPEDNPFDEESNESDDDSEAEKSEEKNSVASVGYRYRKWDLGK